MACSFIGVSGVNYLMTRASVHREILQNDLPLTMNNIYSDLTAELTRPILVSSSMAADTFLKDWVMDGEQDPEKVRKYLLEIKEKYNFFSTFFVSAYSFHYYHFNGIHKQINPADSHDVWYYSFVGSGKDYDLDVDTDEAGDNVLTVFINFRVVDEKERLLGVTGVGLKMESVARLVDEYRERYNRNVYLTDTSGLIQVHQDTSLIEKVNIAEREGIGDVAEQVLSRDPETRHFAFRRDGDNILVNVRYIDSLEWLLFVEQNETESLRIARMNYLRSVVIGVLVSLLIITITLITINRYQGQIERLAVNDELTGVANRRKLEEEFNRFVYRRQRQGQPFCLILMDLDGFKKINDTLGHLPGDEVLRTVAAQVETIVRPTDVLARWGGDEFAIITESSTEEALSMAERIRQTVNSIKWPPLAKKVADPRRELSLSMGIVQYQESETLDGLLYRADRLMYLAKGEGGNRVKGETAGGASGNSCGG